MGVVALLSRLRRRLRANDGFGLIELLAGMTMLNIGILALVTAFSSGQVALRRAATTATASSLADRQMELYRALTYGSIMLDEASINAADTTYKCDASYGTDCNPLTDADATKVAKTCPACPTPLAPENLPTQPVTGPDGKSYRIDSYITEETPTNGRAVRRVTVVVRDSSALTGAPLARQSTVFDAATG
jgi:type II secretory pathway pseudopilin PulG